MFRPKPGSTSRHDLRAMLADGFFFSVMVGMGETYLPAFVLTISSGHGAELAAGLVSSIPLLMGAVLQLLSPLAVRRLRSHRRWIVLCATVQSLSFLPLIAGALAGRIPLVLVFLIAAVYWGVGLGTGPAWNTWVETLVPKPLRTTYFARRTRYTQAGVLFGFVVGGLVLHFAKMADRADPSQHRVLQAFAGLFLTSAICRFISSRFLASQSEPLPLASDHRNVTIAEIIHRSRHGGSERLLLYFASVQFSVFIAGPYFNPFMLGHLQLSESYATYMGLFATSFLTKMLALPALGQFAQRWGAQRLLWLGGIGIVPLSGLWLVSNSIPYLVVIQVVGGVAWAAYELAMFLLFFETIHREERTSVLTIFNAVNALAMVLGSLFGGLFLQVLGEQRESYLLIFGVSSVARLITLLFLMRIPDFCFQPTPIGLRTVSLFPTDGAIDPPILASLPDEAAQSTGPDALAEQRKPNVPNR